MVGLSVGGENNLVGVGEGVPVSLGIGVGVLLGIGVRVLGGGCAVLGGAIGVGSVAVRSTAPMSHFAPCGRVMPRWSFVTAWPLHPPPDGIASTAGLVDIGSMVGRDGYK